MGCKVYYRDAVGREGAVDLGAEPVYIGRSVECAIRTEDARVSRRHAQIVFEQGRYWIQDLGSANGVYVNDRRVPRYAMTHDLIVRCGSLWLRFFDGSAGAAARSGVGVAPSFPANAVTPPGLPVSSYGAVPAQLAATASAAIGKSGAAGAAVPGEPLASMRAPVVPRPVGWGGDGAASTPAGRSSSSGLGRPVPGGLRPSGVPVGPAIPQPVPMQPSMPMPMPMPAAAADPRQAKGGGDAGSNQARIYDLEQQVSDLEARVKAAEAEAAAERQKTRESERTKRRVEQLQADLRRARGADVSSQIEELQSACDRLEDRNEELKREADRLREELDRVRSTKRPVFGNEREQEIRKKVKDVAQALNDALSEVRINIRTASDEVAAQASALPKASAQLVKDSLMSCLEQMEGAKIELKKLRDIDEN